MKFDTVVETHSVKGRVHDLGDFDEGGVVRRAESFQIDWWPLDDPDEETVHVAVRGRRVTKAGELHKADSFHYSIFNRDARHLVIKEASEQGLIPVDVYHAYLAERRRA